MTGATRLPTTSRPAPTNAGRSWWVWAALGLLVGSGAAIAIAPALMPGSYSVVDHSVSESAAQGVAGAWLARAGFLLLGFAVLACSRIAGARWELGGTILHRIYAVAMIATAAFSHAPWEGMTPDPFEDTLHSVAASVVGLAFTLGVITVALRRRPALHRRRIFDVVAVLAAMVIPILMLNVASGAGLVQRLMFLIGYSWYATEALRP